MSADVALDGLVGQQLGEVALGHHQVEQVGAVVGFGLLILLLHLVHLLLELFDLLDGCSLLLPLGRLEVGALLWRRGLERGFGMGHGDGVVGNHQLHCFHLSCGLNVAQDARNVWGELFVLHQCDGHRADAFEKVDAPVDGAEVNVERPGEPSLAYASVDGADVVHDILEDLHVAVTGVEDLDPVDGDECDGLGGAGQHEGLLLWGERVGLGVMVGLPFWLGMFCSLGWSDTALQSLPLGHAIEEVQVVKAKALEVGAVLVADADFLLGQVQPGGAGSSPARWCWRHPAGWRA
jgi:hypothetical protein